MILLNSEQIMRAESEHGARSFMDVIGDTATQNALKTTKTGDKSVQFVQIYRLYFKHLLYTGVINVRRH